MATSWVDSRVVKMVDWMVVSLVDYLAAMRVGLKGQTKVQWMAVS